MERKYYIYYRSENTDKMCTTVILGNNPKDACIRARRRNILGCASNSKYYVNESGTTEVGRRTNFAEVSEESIASEA